MTHRYTCQQSQTPVRQTVSASRFQTPTFPFHHHGHQHLQLYHHGNNHHQQPHHHQHSHQHLHQRHQANHYHYNHHYHNQPGRYGLHAQSPHRQQFGQQYPCNAGQGNFSSPAFQQRLPSPARTVGPLSTPHLHQTPFQPTPPSMSYIRQSANGPNAIRAPMSRQQQAPGHRPQQQSESCRTHQVTSLPKQASTERPDKSHSLQQPMSMTEQQTEQGLSKPNGFKIPRKSAEPSNQQPKNDGEKKSIIHRGTEEASTTWENSKSSSSVSTDHVYSVSQALKGNAIQDTVDKGTLAEQSSSSINSDTSSGAVNKRRRKISVRKKTGSISDKGPTQYSEEQQKQLNKQLCDQQMLQQTKKMFPDLLNSTINLPPQLFNTLSINLDTERALHVQHESGNSDLGCQHAETDVRRCLETIQNVTGEAMCVLFNYSFDNYLQKLKTLFCRPVDLDQELKRGDFDVLILSPKLGCLAVETKAMGYNQSADLDGLRKKVRKAVLQLDKDEKILDYIFRDLVEEGVAVTKVLALPNVRRELLRAACLGDEGFAQMLRSCSRAETTEEALATVLCADDLPPTPTHTPHTSQQQTPSHQALLRWWSHVTKAREDPDEKDKLERNVCETMIARLASHNSKITVESTRRAAEARTVAQCIHLTGLRYGRALLREDQVQILDCPEPFVYLTGTPGSGKTLVLGLKGLEWARRGDHVVVFVPRGVGWGSLVSLTLYERIKQYAKQATSARLSAGDSRRETASRNTGKKRPSNHADTDSTNPATDQPPAPHDSPTEKDTPQSFPCTTDTTPNSENHDSTAQTRISKNIEGDELLNTAVEEKTQNLDSPANMRMSENLEEGELPNIHTATVEKTEDTERFVRELLCKYSDRPLRILVDEGPTKVNVNSLLNLLRDGLNALEKGAERVKSLETRKTTGSTCDLFPQRLLSCLSRASEQQLEKVKRLVSKVRHHLQVISERLEVLQPSHCRPPVTQSAQWKDLTDLITAPHAHIASFLDTLHDHLLTLQESGKPCGDFDQGVGDVLELTEDVLAIARSSGEPGRLCRTQKDIIKPAEDSPCPSRPATDGLNPVQLTGNCRTCPETAEDVSPSEVGMSSHNSDISDLKCPQGKQFSFTSQTDASTLVQTPDTLLQADQTTRNETVSKGDCSPVHHTTHHQDTHPENQDDGHSKGIPNTSGPQGVTGADTEPSRATLPSPDMDQVLEVLDKLEAGMLEASGKLFNVETQMDFFVIKDILSLLVKERDRREVSVWSSGVMPFYQPQGFELKTLNHCQRCPPTVQTVLSWVEKDLVDCPNYSYQTSSLQDKHFPLPTDGPDVKLLNHGSHVRKVKDILDCRECGDSLAHYLFHTLGIGGESGLRAEDVAISGSLDITHIQGRPFFQALMDQGIKLHFPLQQVTSPPPYRDKVFVIGGCPFQGLECKVVVFIPDVSRISDVTSDVKEFRPELPDWLRGMGRWNRCHLWFVASRCLSQLVVFHV